MTMQPAIVVSGTDTNVGKTVFSAALTRALKAQYWKPVQSGSIQDLDTQTVTYLAGLSEVDCLPEVYRLSQPLSPHRAAELDNTVIDAEKLYSFPAQWQGKQRPLIIEGAGGVMVPLTRHTLYIDVMAHWQAPTIVCARTDLGTINHTLLTIDALRAKHISILGIAFIGDEQPDTIQTIHEFSGVDILGRLPWLPSLSVNTVAQSFLDNFNADNIVVKAMEVMGHRQLPDGLEMRAI